MLEIIEMITKLPFIPYTYTYINSPKITEIITRRHFEILPKTLKNPWTLRKASDVQRPHRLGHGPSLPHLIPPGEFHRKWLGRLATRLPMATLLVDTKGDTKQNASNMVACLRVSWEFMHMHSNPRKEHRNSKMAVQLCVPHNFQVSNMFLCFLRGWVLYTIYIYTYIYQTERWLEHQIHCNLTNQKDKLV